MDRPQAYLGERRARPTAWGAVSTWTPCDCRLVPRRANEGYTAERPARARLVSQAYHRHPGRTAPHAPCASTRSLPMPAEQEHLSTAVRRRGFPVSDMPGFRQHTVGSSHEAVSHTAGCCQGDSACLKSFELLWSEMGRPS